MAQQKLQLQYRYSKFWLIFWLICFFPLGIILLITGATVPAKGKRYSLSYQGSRMWLCLWAVLFFPVAFLLLILNGVCLVIDDVDTISIIEKR